MLKKFREFFVPGMYHNVLVRIRVGLRKIIAKKVKDKNCLAYYEHRKACIHIAEDLPDHVKLHTLCHEYAHHVLDTLEPITDEEAKCDLLGSFLVRILESKEEIIKNLVGQPKD